MMVISPTETPFGTFRGQRALIVSYLSKAPAPVTLEQMVKDLAPTYEPLINEWAKTKAGGVNGSIRYHIRELKKLGQVKVMTGAKTQLVQWGNSHAVRIPKSILDQANLREGEELEIRVEDGQIWLEPLSQKPTLDALVRRVTTKNRHGEQDWGTPVGNEAW